MEKIINNKRREIASSNGSDERTIPVKFLKNLFAHFTNEAERLYDRWKEYPFIYTEKQLNTLLFPALLNMKCSVFSELPFKKSGEQQRFLDYYVEDGNNIYLIELKHSRQSYHSGIKTNTKADDEWLVAIEQIQDLTKSVVRSQIVGEMDNYNVFRMALMVMPVSSTKSDIEQEAFKYANELHAEFNRYRAEKNRPEFVGVWSVDNYEVFKQKYSNANPDHFPYVAFVAKIEKIF